MNDDAVYDYSGSPQSGRPPFDDAAVDFHGQWRGLTRWQFAVAYAVHFLIHFFLTRLLGPQLLSISPFLAVILFVQLGASYTAIHALRIWNGGLKPYWGFLAVVPLAHFWALFRCLCAPPDYESHGKLDLLSKIMLFVLVLIFIPGPVILILQISSWL